MTVFTSYAYINVNVPSFNEGKNYARFSYVNIYTLPIRSIVDKQIVGPEKSPTDANRHGSTMAGRASLDRDTLNDSKWRIPLL